MKVQFVSSNAQDLASKTKLIAAKALSRRLITKRSLLRFAGLALRKALRILALCLVISFFRVATAALFFDLAMSSSSEENWVEEPGIPRVSRGQ